MKYNMKEVEELEYKYLKKYYYFLKFAEDEMMLGFKTKEKIKDDWYKHYNRSGISDFAVGAERIVYALLNGKGIGQPNSSPVGSDLFFEVEDAYIHIDLKTVQTDNIGDYNKSIFVGENQNSYKGTIVANNDERPYNPCLPFSYNEGKKEEKICLSYFVTILYERENLDILVVSIMSMPNGFLEKHYGSRVLKAGKNPGKARYKFAEVTDFEQLEGNPKRIQVVYFNKNMNQKFKKDLMFYEDLYDKQNMHGLEDSAKRFIKDKYPI